MNSDQEQAYLAGRRAGLVAAMSAIRTELGSQCDPIARLATLEQERAAAIVALRDMYEERVGGTGDRGDFPDNLWLADIIEKYIHRRIQL